MLDAGCGASQAGQGIPHILCNVDFLCARVANQHAKKAWACNNNLLQGGIPDSCVRHEPLVRSLRGQWAPARLLQRYVRPSRLVALVEDRQDLPTFSTCYAGIQAIAGRFWLLSAS